MIYLHKMLKILLIVILAIIVIVSLIKFEIALFKFLLAIGIVGLVCVLVYL